MEEYGKAAPRGRRIFHFRAKNAPLPPSALPKKEKRRRMRDGVPGILFKTAAPVGGCPFKNGSAHRHGIWRILFKTAASRR